MDINQIGNNIVSYALQIGLLTGIGAALPAVLRMGDGGQAAHARLRYWQWLLIACLALPWIRPWHTAEFTTTTGPAFTVNVTDSVSAPVAKAIRASSVDTSPVMEIALALLAMGAFVRLGWLVAGARTLSRYRRQGRLIAMPAEWAGVAGHAQLLVSEEIAGPVTFGFLAPVVLLPANFEALPDAMRNAILFHELVHVERRDWLFTAGEELLRAVFWFHPAVWWVLGEIQLAREQTVDQTVIEMTQARDPYLDTLLAMAGVEPQAELTPAPLFLRRRHLRQRLMGIVREESMSKTRLIFAQCVALTAMAAAGWFVAGAIPLEAQPRVVTIADDAGVTVNTNGVELMHRGRVTYPAEALAKGVEGTVVVQVRVDAAGEVIDASVLSGPDELRRSVQQSVLGWHFDKSVGGSTRAVNEEFRKPAAAVVLNGAGIPAMVQHMLVHADNGDGPPVAVHPPAAVARKISSISVTGLSEAAHDQLLAQLPVHVGDEWSAESTANVLKVAKAFDSHLIIGTNPDGLNWLELQIRAAQDSAFVTSVPANRVVIESANPTLPAEFANAAAGAVRVSSGVMSASLIDPVKPVYPPLAKMARQQGTVRLDAVIGEDGTMQSLTVLSGPPLLVPAAVTAVKQWTYKPMTMNGEPRKVATTIDVNFSLSEF